MRPIARRVVVGAGRPAPVEREGQHRQAEHRARSAKRPLELERSLLPQGHDPHPGPEPPHREAHHEEVVALAHLVEFAVAQRRLERVAVLEVQVEQQPRRQRGKQREQEREALLVPARVLDRAPDAEPGEEHREGEAQVGEHGVDAPHAPRPLPVEILEVVDDLRAERRQPRHQWRLVVLRAIERLRERDAPRLAVGDHRADRGGDVRARGRGLVDDGAEPRSDRQEEVDGEPDDGCYDAGEVEPPVQQRPWVDHQHEDPDRGGR